MTDLERALQMAVDEIAQLRRRNEVLAAKVEMIDLFACVLHTSVAARSSGASEDVAWLLRREIDRLKLPEGETR